MGEKRRKIGIMGGTFDPIHIGHLILGEKAYEQFGLEKVLFLPSGNPPHKRNRKGQASDEQRVAMVGKAIASNPHFELSLEDMHEEGYSYTYRTLEILHKKYPDVEFYFIIGADSLFDFDTWKEPAKICSQCTIVVATRNHISSGDLQDKMKELTLRYHGCFLLLETMNMDISSQMIRSWIQESASVRYYLTDEVIALIEEQHIYQEK